jgi:S-adenosylmethionine hydrolase
MEPRLITLTTDFGHQDPFVGIMKGVIFGINPNARIVDLSHGIPPQDIRAGALALCHSAPFFPLGTIHVAVVDPGVGSERKPILIESEGSYFVGPDNGILSLAVEGKRVNWIVELSEETYHLKPKSATFHGRDIFAPVAAHLSLGIPASEFGEPAKDYVRLRLPEIVRTAGGIQGEIIYSDSFGNLVTNIRERDLQAIQPQNSSISLGSVTIHGLSPNYSTAAQNDYVAVINSWDLLEISCFMGNARQRSGANIGDRVEVYLGKDDRGRTL